MVGYVIKEQVKDFHKNNMQIGTMRKVTQT